MSCCARAGLWWQLNPPFEFVVCGAGWVLLWCVLKPATGYVGSGASCSLKSAAVYAQFVPPNGSYKALRGWLPLMLELETL